MTESANEALPLGVCAREECTVATGGSCLRGFADPVDCDDFELAEPEDDDAAPVGEPSLLDRPQHLDVRGRRPWQPSGKGRPLHTGTALTYEEATGIMRHSGAAMVVPIGAPGVGKTTLLAALYETLASGAIAGFSFAGSLSLTGFEARSFHATRGSGRRVPDTPRTTTDTTDVLLHLALRSAETGVGHLLLADVSGEHAEVLRRRADPGDYGPLLQSATCVLVLIDGARLTDPRQRHAAGAEARTTARAVRESGLLRPGTPVIFVATKWDLCGSRAEEAQAASDLLTGLASEVEKHGLPTGTLRLAARPAPGAPSGDGFGAALPQFMRLPCARRPSPAPRPVSSAAARRFTEPSAVALRFLRARA